MILGFYEDHGDTLCPPEAHGAIMEQISTLETMEDPTPEQVDIP